MARIIRNNNRPFGGVQLILCGDFLQVRHTCLFGRHGMSELPSAAWEELCRQHKSCPHGWEQSRRVVCPRPHIRPSHYLGHTSDSPTAPAREQGRAPAQEALLPGVGVVAVRSQHYRAQARVPPAGPRLHPPLENGIMGVPFLSPCDCYRSLSFSGFASRVPLDASRVTKLTSVCPLSSL